MTNQTTEVLAALYKIAATRNDTAAQVDISGFTTTDFRLATYWEHYEAGGAFDDLTPQEYESFEQHANKVWKWCEEHGHPVFSPPLAP